MKYYIKTGDEIHGPLDAGGVRLLMAKKDFKDSHLIRPEGEELWVPLGSIEEFNQSDQRPGREISPLAVASIALAFSSVLLLFLMMIFPVPLFSISSLAAVIFGHLALRRMKQHPGHVREYGMARGGLWLGYFLLLFPLAVLYQGPGPSIQNQGNITKAISNCRQIITTLRIYSSDHEGKYPDAALPTARSSNAVFRRMFVDGEADNEQIFGSPASVFFPDGNIGTAPDYREALQAGENHWAMTKGLTDSSDGNIPLVLKTHRRPPGHLDGTQIAQELASPAAPGATAGSLSD